VGVPSLDTAAGTILWFTPVWRKPLHWLPVLSAYVVGAARDGDTCLCLDARFPDVPADAVREMVVEACESLGEGQPFAEVLLVEEPVDDDPGTPVSSAPELIERLALSPPRASGDAGRLKGHALWAKGLVDRLQARADRALLMQAPAPSAGQFPLVTVRIPTYGSTELLVERALPSVLNGSYRNVEVLVCSDGPQPHARAAVEAVEDPRVRYLELGERLPYPKRARPFWQTAGTFPVNRLLDEVHGDFVAPLDHDDAFSRDHVECLLGGLVSGEVDFVFGQAVTEYEDRTWGIVGSAPLRHGHIVHASVLYSMSRLGHMRYDPHAWMLDEPGDWNMWRRIAATGAAIGHIAVPVAVHFREGSSMDGRPVGEPARDAEDFVTDVLETSARLLLGVGSRSRGMSPQDEVAGI
jgi:hypothetical protein